ncbi:hypothetical protein [Enterovibrio norvegicus]|uniref:hypothetical protein n=1 Tax=Enterovibrio norvegicus TaxID=188144 RepID=UPI00352E0114
MKKTYVIWNKSKFAHENQDAETYEQMLASEDNMCGCLSSVIRTHDIHELIQAIYNETDIELNYHHISQAQLTKDYLAVQWNNARHGITYRKLRCQLDKLHAKLQRRYQQLMGALSSLKKNKGAIHEND